jgi:transposase
MSASYARAIRDSVPQAEICFDPFHVVRLGQRAVDQVRRDEWNAHDRSHTRKGRWIKGTRWSLRAPRGANQPGGMRGPPSAAATAGRSWGQSGC